MSGAAALDGEFEVVEAGFKMFCKEQQNVKKNIHQGNKKLLLSKI